MTAIESAILKNIEVDLATWRSLKPQIKTNINKESIRVA